ncbi:hypothetical protein V495_02991 [Pseudogymnoascus sp. VKM F-4514 (FW-929)]|nr:hypothetical protein V495_02991 [Pseudogymnoascus sp. VKM F-4514 (FW-929)]
MTDALAGKLESTTLGSTPNDADWKKKLKIPAKDNRLVRVAAAVVPSRVGAARSHAVGARGTERSDAPAYEEATGTTMAIYKAWRATNLA